MIFFCEKCLQRKGMTSALCDFAPWMCSIIQFGYKNEMAFG